MKLFGMMMALVMAFGLLLGPTAAWAAGSAHTDYTAVAGTQTTFNSYLVVDNDSHIPALTVSYSVSAGSPVDANTTAGTLAVLAGLTPEAVTVNSTAQTGTTSFTANQTTTAGTATDGIVNSTDKKYATNTVTLDFSDVSFPEPGVYRYVITQEPITNTSVVPDSVLTRTVDVYIQDVNGALTVQGYVMYSGTEDYGPAVDGTIDEENPEAVKTRQYVNSVTTYDLTVSKTVTGNQGSKDKYFQFTITISGVPAGTVVDLVRTNMTAAPTQNAATIYTAAAMTAANGVASLTADASGEISYTVYLSHGESVQLLGIPKDAGYAVTEAAEDYSCTLPDNDDGTLTADTTVAFTNSRTGTVPTGVMLTVVPGVIIVGLGAAGLILFNRKKRDEE